MIKFLDQHLIGIKEIDFQHKEIVEMANILYINCLDKNKWCYIIENLEQIKKFIDIHFFTEEQYMKNFSYPYIEEHLESHKEFFNLYVTIRNLYETEGVSSNFLKVTNSAFLHFINDHLELEDKKLANYIINHCDHIE